MGGRKVDPETQAWRERNPLRAWRTKHDKTAADVAGEARVAFASIGLWESGGRALSDAAVTALAAVMGRSEESLRRSWRRWENERPASRVAA